MKFFMALAVVAIHVTLIAGVGPYPKCFEGFIRMGVPFFFVTSGFLLGIKLNSVGSLEERGMMLKIRAMKLWRIYGLWVLIYLPLSFFAMRDPRFEFLHWIQDFFYDLIIMGRPPLAFALWFLYSLAIMVSLLWIFRKVKGSIYWLMGVFTVLAVLPLNRSEFPEWINALNNKAFGGVFSSALV